MCHAQDQGHGKRGRGRGLSDLASQVYMINCVKALLQSSSIIR